MSVQTSLLLLESVHEKRVQMAAEGFIPPDPHELSVRLGAKFTQIVRDPLLISY